MKKQFKETKETKNKERNMASTILFFEQEDKNNLETQFLQQQKRFLFSDNVSSSFIDLVMKVHFPTSELVLLYTDTHLDFKIRISDLLLSKHVKNWQFNRPPDSNRCPDIAKTIVKAKRHIDTKLYLNYNHKNNYFEIYDGIHRYTALKIIKQENESYNDSLLETEVNEFSGDFAWLFNQYIIVNIIFGATTADIINAFETLNKAQTVPQLYIRDQSREKREVIETIVNEWSSLYKKHFTSSANCILGNTNRNKFVELLDGIYVKHNIDGLTDLNRFKQLLMKANLYIRSNIPPKIGLTMRTKCIETGCFLFLYKNDVLIEQFI